MIGTPKAGFLVVDPIAPDSLTRRAALNSSSPVFAGIAITNSGGGVLDWQAHILGNSSWLSLMDTSGTAPESLYVRMDPKNLTLGTYWDTVVVSATGASGVAQQTPIKFEIQPCGEIPILVNDSLEDTLTGADCGAPHHPDHYAKIYRFNGTKDDSVSVYMTSEFDGYVALDTSLAPTAPPLVQQDDCIGAPGDPCIVYQRLPATRQYWVEVTSSAPAESGEFTLQVPLPRAANAPATLDQRSDATTSVPPGGTLGQTTITLQAVVSDRDLGDSLYIEPEVRQNTTGFTGSPTAPGGVLVANGDTATVTVTVNDNTPYHWRVRAVDNTGRESNWTAFGGNPDFRVDIPQAPNSPSVLTQTKPDGTPLATGAVADTDVVVLGANVLDQDPGDQVRLQVEVRPIGIVFSNVPTDSSAPVTTSGVTQVSVGPLGNNTSYHWQARATDQTGRFSSWVAYGGNGEPNGIDFRIALANVPLAPTNLAQFLSDGTTSLPLGGVSATPSVVLKATVSDPDVGQTLQLEVEVKPTTVAFTDVPNFTSSSVANGALASVTVGPLSTNTDYHWQARARDNTNRSGAFVSFPQPTPNLETDPDFKVLQPPVSLVFNVQPPVNTVAGVNMTPAIQVTAKDINGQTSTGFTGAVVMTLENAPGATLLGTTTVAAVAGVAQFNDLHINKAGNGYILRATTSSPSLTQTSSAFNITPAATSQLVFTTNPPPSTTAGVAMNPAVVVTAEDQFLNQTAFNGTVQLAIANNAGNPPGTLTGGAPVTAVGGVANFAGVSINKTGTGYTLQATSPSAPGLKPDTSTAFNITPGPPTNLNFLVNPVTTAAGAFITPAVQVEARDVNLNRATSFASNITVAIGTNPPGNAILSGTTTVLATSGVSSFGNLSIDKLANGYTLTAAATGLTGATSTTFNIINSPISPTLSTVVATTPITACSSGCTTGGGTLSLITVTARDGIGNPVQGATVTLTATGANNTLTQPIGTTNASGVATGTLSSTSSIDQKVVSANAGGIGITQTATITVQHAPPVSLTFTPGPTNTTAGAAISPAVAVTARDQFGNTATSFSSLVTMAIAAGPVGGVFAPTSTNTATAANGVATFPNLRIYKSGTGYQLQASGGSLTSPLSSAFTINTAPVNQLTFVVQPSTTADSAPITPPVQVAGQDSVGNNVTSFTGLVRMFIDNPGTNPGGGALSGTTQVNATAGTGIATFSNLRINARGTGYTLLSTSSGLTDGTSAPFDIIAGPASALFFTQQPTQAVAGTPISPAVQVTARDNQGNVATSFSGNVTLTIGSNPPGNGILTNGGPLAATAGVVSFPSASIDKAGSPYTLIANSGVLTAATSVGFNIVSGGVSAITSTIARNPTSITASSPVSGTITSTITVTAKDALSNPIQGATVVISSTGTGNTITQPLTTTDINGVATGTISSTVAESKTLSATINATLINATTILTVNPAAPKQLLFILQPTNTVAGATIRSGTGVTVEVRDTFNNRVTNAVNNVNISILNNAGSPPGTLFGTTPRTPVSGTVTFNDLNIDKAGAGYTLLTSSAGLVSDTSSAFNITAAGVSASQSTVGAAPNPISACSASCTTGASTASLITVTAKDQFGNGVPSASVTISVSGSSNTLSPVSLTQTANGSGVATWTLNSPVPEGKLVTASANAVGITQNVTVTVNAGAVSAAQSTVTVSNASIAACQTSCTTGGGTPTQTLITVTAKDAIGNPVPSASVTLAVSGANNTLSPAGLTQTANGSGVATWLLNSTLAQSKTVSASANSVSITQQPTVSVNAAGASGAQSLLSAGAASITACATSCTTGSGRGVVITATVRDQFNNPIQGATVNFSSSGSANSFSAHGTTNASGVTTSTFSSTTAEGKTVSANAVVGANPPVAITATASVTVNPDAAAQLIFTTNPPSSTPINTSMSPAVVVTALDQFGNTATGFNGTVTLSFTAGTNTEGAGITGNSVAAVNGIATFSSIQIDTPDDGSGYSLDASDGGGVTIATSNVFSITP